MKSYRIRPLQLEDSRLAAEIQVETWHDTYASLMPARILASMTLEIMAPRWQNIIQDNKRNLLLLGAFEGTQLLAVAAGGEPREVNGYEAEIWSMNIPIKNQRRGLGRLLFNQTVNEFSKLAYKSMYLYCIDRNIQALDFYRAMGGVVTNHLVERDGYFELLVIWDSLKHSSI